MTITTAAIAGVIGIAGMFTGYIWRGTLTRNKETAQRAANRQSDENARRRQIEMRTGTGPDLTINNDWLRDTL